MKVKEKYVPGPFPTWTVLDIAGLARPGLIIEIKAVAAAKNETGINFLGRGHFGSDHFLKGPGQIAQRYEKRVLIIDYRLGSMTDDGRAA